MPTASIADAPLGQQPLQLPHLCQLSRDISAVGGAASGLQRRGAAMVCSLTVIFLVATHSRTALICGIYMHVSCARLLTVALSWAH